jgi:AcrR family transcriptional regulator
MDKIKTVDLRIRRTHKLLLEALTQLLTEKSFESISVTEICDKAMINRTTFYKHYTDKYDLVQHGFKALMDDLASKIDYPDMVNESFSPQKPPRHFLFMFQHVLENKTFYKLMLNQSTFGMLRGIFIDWLNQQSQFRIKFSSIKDERIPLPITIRFATGALIEILNWWLENNTPYTPEDMAFFLAEMYKKQFIGTP